MDADTVGQVLGLVADVPSRHVTTYGALAAAVDGCGPRQVGRIIADHGEAVPWWRVVRADGVPASCHAGTAPALLREEGTPMRGAKVDLAVALWRPPLPS